LPSSQRTTKEVSIVPFRLSLALLGLLPLVAAVLAAAPSSPGQGSQGSQGSQDSGAAGRPTTGGSRRALASPAAAATAPAPAGDAFPYQVSETTLANGLKVLAIPYDSPGTLAYVTVVRTGSRDEIDAGHSGFAHFFEHMMFRGTEKYSPERYNDVLKGMGADFNAFTTDDYTLYHLVGPASQLETIADVESDRFQNLKYTEEAFRTEALAILGEYNKDASSPFLPLEEKLRELAYTRHTYKHTTLGFLADIKAMPAYYDYSRQFFARFYRPENCILVVAGDVRPEQVFAVAQRYYGGWQKGYRPEAIPAEPPQRGPRSGHVDWPSPMQPILLAGYHIPAFSDRSVDSATLEVIAELLFAESAPLYQELVVDKQWVDLLQGSAEQRRDPYEFTVIARAKREDLMPGVRQAIERALAELQGKPVERERLARIVSHIRNSFALQLNTPYELALLVGNFLSWTGDVHSIRRQLAEYPRVTPADVQRLARAVFRPENQTLVTLSGRNAPAGAGKPEGGARHADRQ
jgi:zinc protease